MKAIKVHHVMTAPPCTCRQGTGIDEASRLIEHSYSGTLAVVDSRDRLAGILTDRDIAIAVGKSGVPPSQIPVEEVMTPYAYTCAPDDKLSLALARMTDARIRLLPVVDADRHVKGLISVDDILLWGVQKGGVTPKALLKALRTISAAHHPMFDTEVLVEHAVPATSPD